MKHVNLCAILQDGISQMSSWLIAVIGIVYLVVAIDLFFFKANPGLGIAFFGYAIGNVGLYLETMK